jgi:hypothetical protein
MNKICCRCGEEKSIDNFHQMKRNESGYAAHCKDCAKIYYKNNKDKILIKKKEYRDKTKEKRNTNSREWYHQNKEHALEKHKEWTQNNKDKRNECDRNWARSLNGRFYTAKHQANKRNKSFTLSFEEYCETINKPCYYCDNKFGAVVVAGSGIDRIDSNLGYDPGNVVSCCKNCNTVKSNLLSMEEMKAAITLVLTMRSNII